MDPSEQQKERELRMKGYGLFLLRPGDKVKVAGEIIHLFNENWQSDCIIMIAGGIFNETLKCSFK